MQSNLAEQVDLRTPPSIGDSFGGGLVAALLPAPEGRQYALIVSPKICGEREAMSWKDIWSKTRGTVSPLDGFANSEAMNNDWHSAARFCRGLTISGFRDWYLPAAAEQAAIWANLGPNHTPVKAFQAGAAEAYDGRGYWTSTEIDSGYAWIQHFDVGALQWGIKGDLYRVRAVRKVPMESGFL